MRNCLDCGAKNKDVAIKCSECGSENLSFIEEAPKNEFEKKSLFVPLFVCVAIVIAIIAGVIGWKYYSKTVPAKPVESGLSAMISGDCDSYVAQMHPAFKSDLENILENKFGSYEAYRDDQQKNLSDTFGKDYKIKADVVDVYDVSDTMVTAIATNLSDAGYDLEIESAEFVTVRIVIKGDDGLEDYSYESRYSIEVDGKWYLYEDITDTNSSATDTQKQATTTN